jgi:hypothetical protein
MGLMRTKPYKEKNDLSIELSEVIPVVSLETNNLSMRLWAEWRKESEESLFLTI